MCLSLITIQEAILCLSVLIFSVGLIVAPYFKAWRKRKRYWKRLNKHGGNTNDKKE